MPLFPERRGRDSAQRCPCPGSEKRLSPEQCHSRSVRTPASMLRTARGRRAAGCTPGRVCTAGCALPGYTREVYTQQGEHLCAESLLFSQHSRESTSAQSLFPHARQGEHLCAESLFLPGRKGESVLKLFLPARKKGRKCLKVLLFLPGRKEKVS